MTLNITGIGSCRLNEMKNLNMNVFTDVTLCHSTKDILQLLSWLTGDLVIPHTEFCFHYAIWRQEPISLTDELKNRFHKTDVFVLEISSYHTLMYEGLCYHGDIKADPNKFSKIANIPEDIRKNSQVITDKKKDIEKDIDKILKIINQKKLVIITHVLSPYDDKKIPHRRDLINDLKDICAKKGIPIIIPGEILLTNNIKDILLDDYQHYTDNGLLVLRNYYRDKFTRLGLL